MSNRGQGRGGTLEISDFWLLFYVVQHVFAFSSSKIWNLQQNVVPLRRESQLPPLRFAEKIFEVLGGVCGSLRRGTLF